MVVERNTIRKLRYGFLVSHSIVTMALVCIISEIKREIGRNWRFFHTPCIRRPRWGEFPE